MVPTARASALCAGLASYAHVPAACGPAKVVACGAVRCVAREAVETGGCPAPDEAEGALGDRLKQVEAD